MGLDGLNWKEPEPFVDGERAAAFLSMPRKTMMSLHGKELYPVIRSESAFEGSGVSGFLNSIAGCRRRYP